MAPRDNMQHVEKKKCFVHAGKQTQFPRTSTHSSDRQLQNIFCAWSFKCVSSLATELPATLVRYYAVRLSSGVLPSKGFQVRASSIHHALLCFHIIPVYTVSSSAAEREYLNNLYFSRKIDYEFFRLLP